LDILSYLLTRPPAELDPETRASFDALLSDTLEKGQGIEIDYNLPAPKWQFLCYLCDQKGLLAHGSGNPNIDEFEPRQSDDIGEFGNRKAVYAASDAIWAMYFAIVDRDRYVTSLTNACATIVEYDGSIHGPYYFFSINADALPHNPWRQGTIYLLPRDTFEHQGRQQFKGMTIEIAQWASLVPVTPLAKITVDPQDFPFLSQIRGHDPEVMRERAIADPEGFPWLDE
jgi:hypothetical protein